jgi:hypothetical protein
LENHGYIALTGATGDPIKDRVIELFLRAARSCFPPRAAKTAC